MKMEEGDNREPDDGFEPESDGGWYFDLPSGAWERQEQKNRQLRESVRENIHDDDDTAKGDPFRPKSRGLFGMGRKPDEPAPGRTIAGGKWALNRAGQAASIPPAPAPSEDDGEWSTDAFLPRHDDTRVPEPPLQLRRHASEPVEEPSARGMSWNDAFPTGDGRDEGEEGSLLDAMRSWSSRSTAHAPDPVSGDAVDADPGAWDEADDGDDAAGTTAAPILSIRRPSSHEDHEDQPIALDENGEPATRWDQVFSGAPTDTGVLDAMKSWATGELDTGLLAKDEAPAEIPPEFLQPFEWETADAAPAGEPAAAADLVTREDLVAAESPFAPADGPAATVPEEPAPDQPVAAVVAVPGWDPDDEPATPAAAFDVDEAVAGSADWGTPALAEADGPASWADLDAAFAPASRQEAKKSGFLGRLFGRKKPQEAEPDTTRGMAGAWVPDGDSGDIRVVARGAFGSFDDSTASWELPEDDSVTGGWVVDPVEAALPGSADTFAGEAEKSLDGWTSSLDLGTGASHDTTDDLVSDEVIEAEARVGWGTATNGESGNDDSPWSPVDVPEATLPPEFAAERHDDTPSAFGEPETVAEAASDGPDAQIPDELSDSEPAFLAVEEPETAMEAASDAPEVRAADEPSEPEPTWTPAFLAVEEPETVVDAEDAPEVQSADEPSESEPSWTPSLLAIDEPETAMEAASDAREAFSADEPSESEPSWTPAFLAIDEPETAVEAASDAREAFSADEPSEPEPSWTPAFLAVEEPETAMEAASDAPEAPDADEPSEPEPSWTPAFLAVDEPETAADAASDAPEVQSADEPSEPEPSWTPAFRAVEEPETAMEAASDAPEAPDADEPSEPEPSWTPAFLAFDQAETAADGTGLPDPDEPEELPGNVLTLPVRTPEEDDDPWSSFIAARRASGEPFPKGDVPADSNPAGWDDAFPGIQAPLPEPFMHNDPHHPGDDDSGAGWGDIYSGLAIGGGSAPPPPPLPPVAHGAGGSFEDEPSDGDPAPAFPADLFDDDPRDDPWADVAAASGYGGDPSEVAVYRGPEPAAAPPPAVPIGDPPEWDAAPAVRAEELSAGWAGETPDDDVVLQAFYAHANSAETNEVAEGDLPVWGEEPAEHALEGILGKEAASLVDEVSDPVDVPFSRMQGWTPHRMPPPEPEVRGWQPELDDEPYDSPYAAPGGGSGSEPPDGPIIGYDPDPDPDREPMPAFAAEPRSRTLVREIVETVLLAILVFLCVRASFQNFKVDGHSMDPTLADGQFLIVNKLVYSKVDLAKLGEFLPFISAGENPQKHVFHGPERGDIVVLRDPSEPQTDLIKRVIGLPGDTLEISHGQVYINDLRLEEPYITQPWGGDLEKIAIPEGHYFVMGDNRNYSKDSRYPTIGLIREDLIIGKAMFSYWPTSMFGLAPNGSPELAEAKPQLTAERIGD